jgi:hypothetical protein
MWVSMKKGLILCVPARALASMLNQAIAQEHNNMTLPKAIWLYHEAVRPATDAVHERVEHGFAQLWAKARVHFVYFFASGKW